MCPSLIGGFFFFLMRLHFCRFTQTTLVLLRSREGSGPAAAQVADTGGASRASSLPAPWCLCSPNVWAGCRLQSFLFGPSKSSLSLTVQPCLLSNPPYARITPSTCLSCCPPSSHPPRLTHCLASVRRDMLIVPPVGRNINHSLCVFAGAWWLRKNVLPPCLFLIYRPADQHICQVLSSQTAKGRHHRRQKGERCVIIRKNWTLIRSAVHFRSSYLNYLSPMSQFELWLRSDSSAKGDDHRHFDTRSHRHKRWNQSHWWQLSLQLLTA